MAAGARHCLPHQLEAWGRSGITIASCGPHFALIFSCLKGNPFLLVPFGDPHKDQSCSLPECGWHLRVPAVQEDWAGAVVMGKEELDS